MAPRHLPVAAGALLAAAAVIAGPAVPAFAHNTVIAISPDDGDTVTAQPGTVSLETNDALLDADGAGAMDVIGPDGRHYAIECPTITGPVASVAADLGPAGEYTVVWRVVSADGHPISGDFSFDWQPADGEVLAEGADEAVCETAGGSDAVGPGDAVGSADDEADAAGASAATDLLWIGAGVLAVLVAAGVALLFVRRRPEAAEAHDDGEATTGSDGPRGPSAEA
ncbi:hypothetical protein GCM10009819_21340 [Agromyces tropicus]|uniref:CopC domain-containing protein n=1 Tax=Agromyces tropicus TaxID=555371 RepID=A0ABP5G2S6_9MICO